MAETFCLRHFITHDARHSCPECVIADAQKARERLAAAQERANEDAERRFREDREEQEEESRQREREQDPDYWERMEARQQARERDEQSLKAAARFVLLVVIQRLKIDLKLLEAERKSRIFRGDKGGILTILFGSPLPDKDVLTVTQGYSVINLGHLYHYKFDTAFERLVALGFLNASNEKTRSSHIDKAINYLKEQTREEEQSDSWKDMILRRGRDIEKEIRELEKQLEAKAKSAVAAYERSRDTCSERNSTCPGWHLSGFGWAVSPTIGWHWTEEHVLTICGDQHVFETPYEYLAVYTARTTRSSAMNKEDEWGNKQMKAFKNDHDTWCVSHMRSQ